MIIPAMPIFLVLQRFEGVTTLLDTLNGLLSDRDFYNFLDDVTFKAQQVKAVLTGQIEKNHGWL